MIHPIIPIDDERGGTVYIQRREFDVEGDAIKLSLWNSSFEVVTPSQALRLAEALTEMAHAIQRDAMTPAEVADETRLRR